MEDFNALESCYKGFFPLGTDGNAKVKAEYVVKKTKAPVEATPAKDNEPSEKPVAEVVVQSTEKPVAEEPAVSTEKPTTERSNNRQPKKGKGRRRGQNKNRPHLQREDYSQRLCPSLCTKHGECNYGEKCRFIHDVDAYMKSRPADIGKECVTFRKQGVCKFSFACRFAMDHVEYQEGKGYVNMVKSDCNFVEAENLVPRELLNNLRKRKVDFSGTKAALAALTQIQAKRQKLISAAAETKAEADKTAAAAAKEVDGGDTNVKVEEATDDKTSEIKEGENGQDQKLDAAKVEASAVDETVFKIPTTIIKEEKAATAGAVTDCDKAAAAGAVTDCDKAATPAGAVTDCDMIPLRNAEKKTLDFRNKLYLAPLTTCGNLPFRVVCKRQGVDITCGEMAMCTNLLQGQTSEWALIKKHPCEDMFGVQICGAYPDTMARCSEVLNRECDSIDFVDVNMGCPIDLVYKKGAGSGLMRRTNKLFDIVACMRNVLDCPLTVKMRTGVETRKNTAHQLLPVLREYGVDLVTIHGRSREARYTKAADWSYVDRCAKYASPMPIFGNGDVLTQRDYWSVMDNTSISGVMIARGALIKPWLFTEIKERRDWDISSSERFDILRDFVGEGLLHWGSDNKGVETTRRFLLEWLSFLFRYIPLGLLDQQQCVNERPPTYVGRDDMETLLASDNCADWVKISEMLLGKVPDNFQFLPKHKANSYN